MAGKSDKGKGGQSEKPPEELEKELDELVDRALSVMTDLMDPQLQAQLRKRIITKAEEDLAKSMKAFENVMSEVQKEVILKFDDQQMKKLVDFKQFQENLENVMKSLTDPAVARKFQRTFQDHLSLFYRSNDLTNCKEITREEFEAGLKKGDSNKLYYLRKIWTRSMECTLNKETGVEKCVPIEEEKTLYYECKPDSKK